MFGVLSAGEHGLVGSEDVGFWPEDRPPEDRKRWKGHLDGWQLGVSSLGSKRPECLEHLTGSERPECLGR